MPMPQQLRLNLLNPPLSYNHLPTWRAVIALPVDERIAAFANEDTRARLAAEVAGDVARIAHGFADMTVESVRAGDLVALKGRRIADIASERGQSAIDVFLDILVADRLNTCFLTPKGCDDAASWRLRAEYWDDPRVLVGGSDAGAHLDVLATFNFMTEFLGPTVRERELISLEAAVHHITDRPARRFGLEGRGRIEEGFHADLVIFDPATIGSREVVLRDDLPARGCRLFAAANGLERVLVNGVDIVDRGRLTGKTPGKVLRSRASLAH
jgi:N-acyl-D-aspartate/D-glutamate deacylase